MNSVRWFDASCLMEIRHRSEAIPALVPSRAIQNPLFAWKRIDIRWIEDARSTIHACAGEMWKLRSLLAVAGRFNSSLLSNEQVMRQVACMLLRQELLVFRQVSLATGGHSRRTVSIAARPRVRDVTRQPAFRPRESVQVDRPLPLLNAMPEFAPVNSASQTATLRIAAEEGVPLYIPCTLRKNPAAMAGV